VALLGSLPALGGCAGLNDLFKEPTFRLERVVMHGVGLQGGALDLIVRVDNPNQFDLHGTALEAASTWSSRTSARCGSRTTSPCYKGRVTKADPAAHASSGPAWATPSDRRWQSGEIPYSMKGQAQLETPFGKYDVPFEGQGGYR
jgi:hypothetical protein